MGQVDNPCAGSVPGLCQRRCGPMGPPAASKLQMVRPALISKPLKITGHGINFGASRIDCKAGGSMSAFGGKADMAYCTANVR